MLQPCSSADALSVYNIAGGSNVATPGTDLVSTLDAAVHNLVSTNFEHSLTLCARSGYFRTPAFPPGNGPDFVNVVFSVETRMSALDLMAALHRVEAEFGRTRETRWAARTLDLDLLTAQDRVAPDLSTFRKWLELPLEAQKTRAPQELILPHPRLSERAFVLVPLCDVAPQWRHPVLGQTVQEMTQALPKSARSEVVRLTEPVFFGV